MFLECVRRFRLRREHWLALASILPLVMLVMTWGVFALAEDEAPNTLPSVKEALASEIHGKFKLKKQRLQIQYDFRKEEQALDFMVEQRFQIDLEGLTPPKEKQHPAIQPGRLDFPKDGVLRLGAPFSNIVYAMVVVKGVSGFSVEFVGSETTAEGGRKSVAATFSGFPRITIDGDEEFRGLKTINLQPEVEYRFELIVERGKVTGKLNGKKLLEKKSKGALAGLGQLRFSRNSTNRITFGRPVDSSADAYVSKLIVRGEVADDAVVVAANRDRGKKKLPPLWRETFESKGEHFDVYSATSVAVASRWQAHLDSRVTSILANHPVEAAPLPEPAPAVGGEGNDAEDGAAGGKPDATGDSATGDSATGDGADSGATPADKPPAPKPIDKEVGPKPYAREKITVYIFDSLAVHQAYRDDGLTIRGSQIPYASPLPDTRIWTFVHEDGDTPANERLRTWFFRAMVDDVFKQLYRTTPLWWIEGHRQYYSHSLLGSAAVPGAVDEALATAARKYISDGTEPVVSDLLKGWTYERGKPYPSAISWAWVHFLRHGAPSKDQELASLMHRGLRHGMSGEAAGTAVFPVTKFNELYPLFKSYVEGL